MALSQARAAPKHAAAKVEQGADEERTLSTISSNHYIISASDCQEIGVISMAIGITGLERLRCGTRLHHVTHNSMSDLCMFTGYTKLASCREYSMSDSFVCSLVMHVIAYSSIIACRSIFQ